MVLYWLEEDTRLSIFPCLVSYNMKLNSIKYQTNRSSKLYRLEPSRTRKNFLEVNMNITVLTLSIDLYLTNLQILHIFLFLAGINGENANLPFPNCSANGN